MYTMRFSEQWEFAGGIDNASHSTVQDLAARIDVSKYSRIVVIGTFQAGSGNTIDVDMEQANALTGGTLKALDSSSKDVTVADADKYRCWEIRMEEFDTNNGFNHFNIEATPSGARIFSFMVLGLPHQRPASVDNWTGVTD